MYNKKNAESTSRFLELFVRCLGTEYEVPIERVNQSIDDGKFVECINEILQLIVSFQRRIIRKRIKLIENF